MWKAEITKVTKEQIFGVSNYIEFRIDAAKLMRRPKKGEYIEGSLAGGAIIAERFINQ